MRIGESQNDERNRFQLQIDQESFRKKTGEFIDEFTSVEGHNHFRNPEDLVAAAKATLRRIPKACQEK